MKAVHVALYVGAALTLGAGGFAVFAYQRRSAPLRASALPGTYELVDLARIQRRLGVAAIGRSSSTR
jgi:2-hydroxychromene-2-carboxylate isomerase